MSLFFNANTCKGEVRSLFDQALKKRKPTLKRVGRCYPMKNTYVQYRIKNNSPCG